MSSQHHGVSASSNWVSPGSGRPFHIVAKMASNFGPTTNGTTFVTKNSPANK